MTAHGLSLGQSVGSVIAHEAPARRTLWPLSIHDDGRERQLQAEPQHLALFHVQRLAGLLQITRR